MFSKSAKSSATAPARPAPLTAPPLDTAVLKKGPSVASVIGRDITIEGSINGEGELHIDGVVRGDVKIGRLTIGETGQVEGTISAELVEARGKVVGSITAKQVRLFASAQIDGDVTHEQLAMETGASFQGRSLKFQRPPVREAPMGDVISLTTPAVNGSGAPAPVAS